MRESHHLVGACPRREKFRGPTPKEERNAFLQNPLTSITAKTITDPVDLQRLLVQTTSQGYAVADEMLELGLIAIGAPLVNYNDCAVGAISIYGPKSRIAQERVVEIGELVRETADRISARLGYRPGRLSPDLFPAQS